MRRAVLALALVASTVSAHAQTFPLRRQQVLQLQLDGAFAADREHARASGADAVLVRVAGTDRWLSATRARTVGGDPTLFGRDVLAAVAPIQPNLIALGPDVLTHRLAGAADDTPIHMEGTVDIASRTYLLRTVAVGEDADAQTRDRP